MLNMFASCITIPNLKEIKQIKKKLLHFYIMPLFGNEKGHNCRNYGRIKAVIELVRAFMVINLVMKFEVNPLIITQVIERTPFACASKSRCNEHQSYGMSTMLSRNALKVVMQP